MKRINIQLGVICFFIVATFFYPQKIATPQVIQDKKLPVAIYINSKDKLADQIQVKVAENRLTQEEKQREIIRDLKKKLQDKKSSIYYRKIYNNKINTIIDTVFVLNDSEKFIISDYENYEHIYPCPKPDTVYIKKESWLKRFFKK